MSTLFPEDEAGGEFASIEDLDVKKVDDKVTTTVVQPDTTSKIPDKYRGKSVEDIIAMHQNAEALIHRQSEEVGFARKMAEQAARRLESDNGSSAKRPDADQGATQVDFFADPEQAVAQAVSKHPDVVNAKASAEAIRRENNARIMRESIGDPVPILQDPDFVEWAKGNPYRLELLRRADQDYDVAAAQEVFGNFKLYKASKSQAADATKTELKTQTDTAKKAARVDAGSPGAKDTGKIYKRSDLIRLQNTDPERYDRLSDEIMKAYAENRVR